MLKLKDGWIAKDKGGIWYHYKLRPDNKPEWWSSGGRSAYPLYSLEGLPQVHWRDSLREVKDGCISKPCEFKFDEVIKVRASKGSPWYLRHFSHKDGEVLVTFKGGCSSQTTCSTEVWSEGKERGEY